MFRLPFLTIFFWLLLGFSLGWWLHPLYDTPHGGVPDEIATQESLPSVRQNVRRRASETPYQEILNLPAGVPKSLSEAEQITLTNAAASLIENNPAEAEQMLNTWIDRDPGNLNPMFLLAKTYLESQRYARALQTALDLKFYVQEDIPEHEIDLLINTIETEYSAVLKENQNFTLLIELYTVLIDSLPEETSYYYKIAEIQADLALYDDALTSLDYILYDTVWGARAQKLASRIQLSTGLEDKIEVPLEKVDNQFIVSATVDGIPDVRLLIDTGASICVLRPQTAERLGLVIDEEREITVNLPAGVVNTPLTRMNSLAIGDAELSDIAASILEMPPGIQTDGLLGMNFLGNFRFFIDQEDAILYLGSK